MFKKGWKLIFNVVIALLYSQRACGNPSEPNIIEGGVTINTSNPTHTIINQTTDKAIINWQDFSIAPQEITQFVQPMGGIILNRVVGSHLSEIAGTLRANGEVWLINPSGIIFKPGSFIDVPRLIATTLNIKNEDFMASKYEFTQSKDHKHGAIVVEGMKVRDSGIVALVAPGVEVKGIIEARLGKVIIGSGTQMTVDLFGDQLINLGIGSQSINDGITITDKGSIITEAGTVLLTTNEAEQVVQNLINMDGVIKADSAVMKEGDIILTNTTSGKRAAKAGEVVKGEIKIQAGNANKAQRGGSQGIVSIKGKISATGLGDKETGGNITITGEKVGLFGKADINASGSLGGGTILIGGDYLGGGTLPRANSTYVGKDVVIKADALTQGNGGKVIVWSDNATHVFGEITARGGKEGGNGGFIETSGRWLNFAGQGDANAPKGKSGTWLFDPFNVNITNLANANGNFNSGNPDVWTPTVTGSNVNADAIVGLLNNGTNVIIQTSGGGGAEAGDILVNASIGKLVGADATLSFIAESSITLSQSITSTSNKLNIDLQAPNGNILITNTPVTINTNGGTFSSQSLDFTVVGGLVPKHTIINTGITTIIANTALIPNAAGAGVMEFNVGGLNLGIRNSITITSGTVAGSTDGFNLRVPTNTPHIRDILSPYPDGTIPATNPATTVTYFDPAGTHFFNGVDLFSTLTGPLLPPTPTPTPSLPPTPIIPAIPPAIINTVITVLTNPVPPPNNPIQPPTITPENPFQPTTPPPTSSPSAPPPSPPPSTTSSTPTDTPVTSTQPTPITPTETPTEVTTPTPSAESSSTMPIGPEGSGGTDVPMGIEGIGSGPKEEISNPDEGISAIVGLEAAPAGCGECKKGDPGCESGKDPQGGNCVTGVNSNEKPVEIPVAEKGVGPTGIQGTNVPLGAKGIGGGPQEQATLESLQEEGLKRLIEDGIEGVNIEKVIQRTGSIVDEMGPRIDGVNINVNGEGEPNSETAGRIP